MTWTGRWLRRLRTLVGRNGVERELDEEMAFHLAMETEKNLRAGMSPAEARRQAGITFGGVEKYKEEVRDARAFGWLTGVSLDFKLGLRMLGRYPVLTVVAGLALAFAIAAGAATFELGTQIVHPRLPLAEGERVVGIQNWDAAARRVNWRVAADLPSWRAELGTVRELGAFRGMQRNLIIGGGSAEPARLVEVTASGFRVARVRPLMGRYLVDEDERIGAAGVVVISHDLWQRRFRGDPAVIGREVRLGSALHTVVGVMPRGFGFPLGQDLWIPLQLPPAGFAPGEGPELRVFGRLSPGASLADAQAEIALLGQRAEAASPHTHQRIQPRVVPYARSVMDMPWGSITGAAYATNVGVVMFLLLVCANVATLVFARTATRETELVVRTALGASRRRIVLQLFAEALVLGAVAAVIGLAAAALGLRWGLGVFETVSGDLPFWITPRLSLRTLVYAALLALVAAAVAGVLPALKMTGRGAEQRLRQAVAGGNTLRFGRLWTGIIVTQVAITAAFIPLVVDARLDTDDIRSAEVGFPAREYLSARVGSDPAVPGEQGAAELRLASAVAELERRLEAEPGVTGVTYAQQLPGEYHQRRRVEVQGGAVAPLSEAEHRIQTGHVAPDFLQALGMPILAGRGFQPGDLGESARVVVVNESFVRTVLGGRNPIGRRLRYTDGADGDAPGAAPGPWHEIVGVVREITLTIDPDLPHNAGIYHPVRITTDAPLRLAIHLQGDPEAFAPRLRAVATAVDPTLRLHEVRSLDDARQETLMTYQFWVRLGYLACGIVLLFSILGIYSIMSFTVSRRTREIGIRMALGADRWRILRSIFRRAFAQVGLGVGVGLILTVMLAGGIRSMKMVALLAAGAALMLVATLAAGFLPTRRALRIQPMEAMRTDG